MIIQNKSQLIMSTSAMTTLRQLVQVRLLEGSGNPLTHSAPQSAVKSNQKTTINQKKAETACSLWNAKSTKGSDDEAHKEEPGHDNHLH